MKILNSIKEIYEKEKGNSPNILSKRMDIKKEKIQELKIKVQNEMKEVINIKYNK